jgi:hypothetical protein
MHIRMRMHKHIHKHMHMHIHMHMLTSIMYTGHRRHRVGLFRVHQTQRGRDNVVLAYLHQDSVPGDLRVHGTPEAQGYIRIYICMYIYIYTCMCVYVYVCMCVSIRVTLPLFFLVVGT